LKEHYTTALHRMTNSILNSKGDTSPAIRSLVKDHAASLERLPQDSLPTVIKSLVDKVASGGYRVTDTDIDRLRQSGYSEDAIFEIIVCAASATSVERLEMGVRALRSAR
jgi:hypothetical protein